MDVDKANQEKLSLATRMLVQIAGSIIDIQADIAEDIQAQGGEEVYLGYMKSEDDFTIYELEDKLGEVVVTATSKRDGVVIFRVTAEFMPEVSGVK